MWTFILGTAFATPLTLDGALEMAFAENLELAQQRHANGMVRHQLTLARSAFDPFLTAGVSTGRSSTPSNSQIDESAVVQNTNTAWNVGLSQSLPTGGSLSARFSEFQSTSTSANVTSPTFTSDSLSVALSQPLLQGLSGGDLTRLRDAHLDLAVSELRWRAQQEEKVLEVTEAYWDVVSSREQLQIAERSRELAQEQLTQTLEREAAGFAGSGDVLQVKVLAGGAERQELFAKANVNRAALRLVRLLGRPLAEADTFELTDRPTVPDELPSFSSLAAIAEQGNARYLIAQLEFERARRQARRARLGALPSVGLDANASLSAGGPQVAAVREQLFNEPAGSFGVGLNVGLPLVPRDARAQFGIASLQLEQAELQLEAADQDLQLAVAEAARNIERDAATLTAAKQTLEYAELSLTAQKELLAEGRGSTRDVINALESLRAAGASELDARITLQRSLRESDRLTGTLL